MLKKTDNPSVCFRWFRTVETTCDKIFLHFDKTAQLLQWDNSMKLYKSQACDVSCGKHVTNLNINGKYYPCKPFTIVPDSFEVHLFLMEDNINGSVMYNYERNVSLQLDKGNLDNIDHLPESNLSKSTYYDCQTSFSRAYPVKWEVYEEMLTNKNLEIRNLQSELKRLRLSIIDIYSNNFEEINSSNDDASTFEVESNDEKEEIESHVDAKIESDLKVDYDKTRGITSLLESMRHTKVKHLSACKRIQRLQDENLKLQQENIKLRNMLEDNNRADTKNSASDVLCFSEQDTDSTQYRLLPSSMTNIYTSKSLPILNVQQTEINLPRRYASFSEVVLSSEGSEEAELCFKVGSSAQTDITALEDPPKQLITPKKRSVISSETLFNPRPFNSTMNFNYANDDSDTEKILQEAETFLVKTLGSFPATSYSKKLNYSVNDSIVAGSQTVLRHNFQHTNPYVPSTPIVKARRTQLRPFIPKSVKDLKCGHVIKYFSSDGKIQQGKVSYLSSLPDEANLTIVIEDLEIDSFNSSPRKTFVSFKKVILAWEEWN